MQSPVAAISLFFPTDEPMRSKYYFMGHLLE